MRDQLPAVWKVLEQPALAAEIARLGRPVVVQTIRRTLQEVRSNAELEHDLYSIASRVARRLSAVRPALRSVINATGVLLHTGLGRAPLGDDIAQHVADAIRGYCNLEFDLDTGTRGRRHDAVATLLCDLTGAEAALVVNNNAAATLLAFRVVAAGREVIVSRGQLIEIGGEFRLPEIFEQSGARLREVGTTNKTRLGDYERAINRETAAILHVHTSNYRITGFTESVGPSELCLLARAHGLPCIDDIGSGLLDRAHLPDLSGEPAAADSIRGGADLVLFSGDKLLGGPQCGIVVGKREWIDRLARDPLMRALRVDKMTLAALQAILRGIRLGVDGEPLFWRMLHTPLEQIRARAEALADQLTAARGWNVQAGPSRCEVGGGSCPGVEIASWAATLVAPFPRGLTNAGDVAAGLRRLNPPIATRVHNEAVWLDLRTVLPDQDDVVASALRAFAEQETES